MTQVIRITSNKYAIYYRNRPQGYTNSLRGCLKLLHRICKTSNVNDILAQGYTIKRV